MKKHTKATPAHTPRSRARLTRSKRRDWGRYWTYSCVMEKDTDGKWNIVETNLVPPRIRK